MYIRTCKGLESSDADRGHFVSQQRAARRGVGGHVHPRPRRKCLFLREIAPFQGQDSPKGAVRGIGTQQPPVVSGWYRMTTCRVPDNARVVGTAARYDHRAITQRCLGSRPPTPPPPVHLSARKHECRKYVFLVGGFGSICSSACGRAQTLRQRATTKSSWIILSSPARPCPRRGGRPSCIRAKSAPQRQEASCNPLFARMVLGVRWPDHAQYACPCPRRGAGPSCIRICGI